jgi:hypothetical protein
MNKQTHKKNFSLKESKQGNNRNNDTLRTFPMDTKTTGLNLVRKEDIHGHKLTLHHYFLIMKMKMVTFLWKPLAVLILTH